MATEEKKPESKGGGSKLLPIMLGLNSLLIAGVLAMLVLKPGSKTAAAPAEHAAEKSEGHGAEKKAEGEHGEKKPEGEGEKKAEGEKKEGHGSSEGHGAE